jgi:hypothetical protein
MRRNHRPDNVRGPLVKTAEEVGAFWLPSGPFDGWLWFRDRWHLCELKDPAREGHKDEFTDDQVLLMARLNERQIPYSVIRTEADMLKLLGARRTT